MVSLVSITIPNPVFNGTASGTAVSSVSSTSTLAIRDSNGNCQTNNFIQGYTTTATAGGTTTLTVASTYLQFFTGTLNQTVTLPVTSTMVLGQQFRIVNNSTGTLTVNSSGGNLVQTVASGAAVLVTVILTSGTTAASWDALYTPASTAGTGDVVGPASATDNAIVRWDTTTGKLVQDSIWTIADTGQLLGLSTTANQMKVGYDASNYFITDVDSTGLVTFNATGAGAAFIYVDNVTYGGDMSVTGGTNQTLRVGGVSATLPNFLTSTHNNNSTNAAKLPANVGSGGATTTVRYRTNLVGSDNSVMNANESVFWTIIGTQYFTEAATGTHPWAGQLLVKPLSMTNGAGATADAATVLIDGKMTGVTVTGRNLGLWVEGGAFINGGLEITTQTAGNNTTQAASTAFVAAAVPNSSYRTILDCSGSHTAAKVAGTYALGQGDPIAVSGTGTLYPINTIYIDSADYPTVNGVTPKLRIRAQLYVNDVAPTGNFTFGLYPITRPATSGGAGLVIYTLGTVVASSTVLFTAPAADSSNNGASADFALPANGHYVIGVVTTATVAASSHLHMSCSLQMRNA